jgi:tetratricopeptide (TPR) repeat protein
MFPKDAADSARGRDMVVSGDNPMKEPSSAEEVRALHTILRTDPQRYLHLISTWIDINPTNSHVFWERHLGWMKLGEPHKALDDLNKAIELDPEPVAFRSRGEVYRQIGEYEKALADFNRGEALDPIQWENDAFGVYYQADVHARLGDDATALACCARLPDDFWSPGIHGTPGGGKAEIAETLRRLAAEARRTRT